MWNMWLLFTFIHLQFWVCCDGLGGTPHYSLGSRQKDSTESTTSFRHPTYLIGIILRNTRADNTPAANRYTLPYRIGGTVERVKRQGPIFSLRKRRASGSFHEDLSRTPGPGTYSTTDPSIYRNRHPLYNMTSRNFVPGDTTQKPGPGQHSPEKVLHAQRAMPRFSFGIRHSKYTAPLIVDPVD